MSMKRVEIREIVGGYIVQTTDRIGCVHEHFYPSLADLTKPPSLLRTVFEAKEGE